MTRRRAFAGVVCILALALPIAAGAAVPTDVTRYAIVVTGGELLNGAYADGHTLFLTQTLRPLGLQCVGAMCVDDRKTDVIAALGFAADHADLVLVTGGLGPTDNDITREAVSQFTGVALKEHPDVLAAMAQRFGVAPEELGANLRRQTQVPMSGTYLKNDNGTAVGLVFEVDGKVVVALPGPPRELQAMVRTELIPYLARRFGTRLPGCSLSVRFIGLGQSQIDRRLKETVMLPSDIIVNSQFADGRVDFTFSLSDDTPENRARLERLRGEVSKALGTNIYAFGKTTLEQCVIDALKKRGQTLALVEVGSGGALVAALNGAPDAHAVLIGAYVAPTEAALWHLLDAGESHHAGPQGIEALANAAATAAGSAWVLAVGPEQSEDEGSRYVQIVLRRPDGSLTTWRALLRGAPEMAGRRLSTSVLDQLRRHLQ